MSQGKLSRRSKVGFGIFKLTRAIEKGKRRMRERERTNLGWNELREMDSRISVSL